MHGRRLASDDVSHDVEMMKLTMAEYAAYERVSLSTVKRWRKEGKILTEQPYGKGGKVRVIITEKPPTEVEWQI